MSNLDLQKHEYIELERAVALMSRSKDWVADHQKIQPYSATVASAAHRINPNGFTKEQLKTINGFFQTFCNRFKCLAVTLIDNMLYTAQKMPTLPDFSQEEAAIRQETIDICIKKLVEFDYRGIDKDYYNHVVNSAIPLTNDPEIISQLKKKSSMKLRSGYLKTLESYKEPAEVSYFHKRGPHINSNTEYEG